MLSRKFILVCLSSWFIGSFRNELKDGLEYIWSRGSVSWKSETGLKQTKSLNYLQGLLNGIPNYDPCPPSDGPIPFSKPGDAPFSQGQHSYQRSIHCPLGIQNLSRGIVLMIPCTSCNSVEVFPKTLFLTDLPNSGFDVCWINLPFNGLGDMQLSGEFVAYAIDHLASLSSTGKINIVTYSQGGSNAQWAITFWPSIRHQILNLVTVSAPHKGTSLPNRLCKYVNFIGGCLPALLQMSQSSRYMNALYKKRDENDGDETFVPTTSIYTFYDQLVLPQASNSNGVSYLFGASNIALQELCGKNHIIGHLGVMSDLATYGLVYDALIHGRPTSLESFDRKYCEGHYQILWKLFLGIPLDLQLIWRTLIGIPTDRLKRIKKVITSSSLPTEPLLMSYVCEMGYAPQSHCTTTGFCKN
ncbi:hypothetical protein DFH28DRAFT_1124978 [Melampsora americana]|nr:hypothetical protein DFH28DRAFT_1124978 [Melampsora americana]